jgi:hypothetical protein
MSPRAYHTDTISFLYTQGNRYVGTYSSGLFRANGYKWDKEPVPVPHL